MQTQSNNVDFSELAKFQDLASRWWDADSEFKPLHDINPLRLEWIANRVQLTGKKVLDVGCGGGILSESLSHAGAEVLGIDLAEAPLSVARLHALESGATLDYREISAEQCAAEMPEHFDCVTCLEMLEHVPDPALTVASCAAATKPGGRVFFSTINRNPKSWLFAIVGAEYVLRLLPKGTHEWQKFIKPSELAGYCRIAGLRVDEIIGLTYNPLNKRYKLEDDVQVNYMIATTRLESTSGPFTREKSAVD